MFVEVLVVGGGPAGSAAAAALASRGREVLLLDRARFPRPKPCGEYMSPACYELLAELGVADALWPRGLHPHRRLVLRAPDGFGLSVPLDEVIASSREPRATTAKPTAFALDRATFDHALLEHARARGVRVWEGVPVRRAIREAERVAGVEATVDGAARTIRARLVIAADGARSTLARRLGLARRAGRHRKFGLVARYGDVTHAVPDAVEMHVHAPGYCGFALEANGEANVGMVVDGAEVSRMGGDPSGYFAATLPRFAGIAAQLRGARRLGKVATVGPIAAATVRQSGHGVLLIGDAAGFYDPFTGQGITFALQTARLAAAVADSALAEGDLSAWRLAAYDRARAALLGPKVQVHRAIQAFMARPAWFGAALRRLEARPALARRLIGVTADLCPPETVWSLDYLARLARP
jgi:geranylgeranyl reductase family protein